MKSRAAVMVFPFLVLSGSPAGAQVTFDSSFQSGNGHLFQQVAADVYSFQLEPDTNSSDRQWFAFDVNGAAGRMLTFRLLNTGTHNVPSHWGHARPVFSRDGGTTWDHVAGATTHSGGVYTFSHTFEVDKERLAFHHPYTFTMAMTKMNEWAQHPHATRTVLGLSVLRRPIMHFRVTDDAAGTDMDKRGIWITGRLHAAEVTGSYSVEGFMDFLLSDAEEAVALRQNAVIHIVPMANPDGVFAGNYRNNHAGVNLNRVWNGTANLDTSPEVVHIQGALDAWVAEGKPYDLFIDFHSTSGVGPHFAFHADANQQPPLYHEPSQYHAHSRALLALVNSHAPFFSPTRGASSSNDQRLAYHRQRLQYGVLAFTPEGVYVRANLGPEPNAWLTPDHHRQVGEAFAKAIVAYYGMEAVVPGVGETLQVY
jgi:murein tripeptide amidase MpaA